MRRPFAVYVLGVVLPAASAMAGGATVAGSAWDELRREGEERVAFMTVRALEQDLRAAWTRLGGEAAPDPGDPVGSVLTARAPLPPSAAEVGRLTGMRTAVYVRGVRLGGTDPPPGPERLGEDVLQALAGAPGRIHLPRGAGGGVLVAGEESSGELAALAALAPPIAPALPLPFLLVMALLMVFAVLAGWILLTGRGRRPARATLLLLSLVPAAAVWGSLFHAGRLYRAHVEESERRALGRALAVGRARGVTTDPVAFEELSGFRAYLVRDGGVVAASLPGDEPAVAALPAPPPSFTSAGTVATREGSVPYVALRVGGAEGFTVVTAPSRVGREPTFDARLGRMGAALAGWFLLLGSLLWAGARSRGGDA